MEDGGLRKKATNLPAGRQVSRITQIFVLNLKGSFSRNILKQVQDEQSDKRSNFSN
jgi:hypothetical protein